MKNIFKLMGLALIAGSLAFVSCSKDDDETVMSVTYGETSWEAVDFSVVNAGATMTATLYGDKSEDFPAVTFVCGTTAQRYDLAAATNFVSYDADGKGDDVCLQEGHITINSFDATNHTMDANIEAKMQSGNNLTVTIENATWKVATLGE